MNDKYEYVEKKIFSLTSMIKGQYVVDGKMFNTTASGFFYSNQKKTNDNFITVNDCWFITNRHVVLHKIDDKEILLDYIEFGIRIRGKIGEVRWIPIKFDKAELSQRLKLHVDSSIDVVLINVTDIIHNFIKYSVDNNINNLEIPVTLSNFDLPTHKPIPIEVTTDIVVVSYPKGYYDVKNKFPIVKSGIIASAWGADFNGNPQFLIDAQLFPGSSGGLVISKPTHLGVGKENMMYSLSKQFVFLGIYSGEPRFNEKICINNEELEISKSFGLGTVWYYYLILEIIKDGYYYNE